MCSPRSALFRKKNQSSESLLETIDDQMLAVLSTSEYSWTVRYISIFVTPDKQLQKDIAVISHFDGKNMY